MDYVKRFIEGRVLSPFREVLSSGIKPQVLALSVCFGISGGLFPIPATTSLICVLYSLVFPVNLVIVQIINLCLTPIQLATFLSFVRWGDFLLGAEATSISSETFQEGAILENLHRFGWSFARGVVAWSIFSVSFVLCTYPVILMGIQWKGRRAGNRLPT